MRRLRAGVFLFAMGSLLWGQAERTVRLDFSNPKLVPGAWTLELHPDGTGHFRSQRGDAPREAGEGVEAPDQDLDIQVNAGFAAHVFETAEAVRFFAVKCESGDKVAFQGTKHFSYQGPDGKSECSYNYSRDKRIQLLGDQLEGVAASIVEGARIERLRQHDRLGLDAEMQSLTEMLADGRAGEIEVIRATLESVAGDEALMERVRKRAREMLGKAGSRE